jgi:hypothetical protein
MSDPERSHYHVHDGQPGQQTKVQQTSLQGMTTTSLHSKDGPLLVDNTQYLHSLHIDMVWCLIKQPSICIHHCFIEEMHSNYILAWHEKTGMDYP